jgi:hypothetical protein
MTGHQNGYGPVVVDWTFASDWCKRLIVSTSSIDVLTSDEFGTTFRCRFAPYFGL